uniref:Uncharacterized protein n=1 Tax=Rhizophora mucronata TaxID=61149 RepID=A0A2P2Q8X4_RHIMU
MFFYLHTHRLTNTCYKDYSLLTIREDIKMKGGIEIQQVCLCGPLID